MVAKRKSKGLRGETDMLRRVKACATLRQWRDEVLGLSQTQVALLAKVDNTRLSRIEGGDIPKNRRNWRPYLKAYQLDRWPTEFERLVRGAERAVTA